jgi:lipopolysaccharide transport system ATP-binding protein
MMSAIRVDNLSKEYVIGAREKVRESFREMLYESLLAPYRRIVRQAGGAGHDERFWALKDVGFEVRPGETVGIIGKNGAGKSTLLKILSRITAPTTGRIELYGRVSSLLEVGTGFHPELTGRENIFLNGAILGMGKAEIRKKFDEIVSFSEIEKFIDTPVKRYSSGMYVRLAFAVAAHMEPEILIIDEVLAVGDVEFQRKCLGKMGNVSAEGRTILFVSHNMSAVQKLCSSCILLDKGRILSSGKTPGVIDKYMDSNSGNRMEIEIPEPGNKDSIPGYAYKLRVENAEGNPISEVPVGEPWRVRVFFHLKKRTEHFVIALGMTSILDVPLRTSYSQYQDLEPGDYQVIFTERSLLLSTGKYNLILGLSSYEKTFQYVENVASVIISDVSGLIHDENVLRTSGAGLILNKMEIDITKNE